MYFIITGWGGRSLGGGQATWSIIDMRCEKADLLPLLWCAVTRCCQKTFALMTNLKKWTTASRLIRNLASSERQEGLPSRWGAVCSGALWRNDLPGTGVSYSLVSAEMRRGGWTFLSCVSKQLDSFERHLDYRVKSCSLNLLKASGCGRHATSKHGVKMRSESS